jgi:predicted dienelactone hydrolase
MRFTEICIVLLVLIRMIAHLFETNRSRRCKQTLPVLALALSLINFLINRHRWQMVPITIFLIGMIILDLIHRKRTTIIMNKVIRKVSVAFSFLLFILTLIFPLLLPVPDLPEPGGPYAVGRTSFRMTDPTREEIFTANNDDVRSVLVTAWYPAAEQTHREKPAAYWDQDGFTGKAYSLSAEMGTFWYSHLSDVRTNSYTNAPVSTMEESYPVVIYSHSFVGLNTENTMLFEELASQGYVVFSIGHTYETIVSIYPDGETVGEDYTYIFNLYNSNSEQEIQLYEDFETAGGLSEKREIIRQILTVDDSATNMLRVRTEDVVFVLDEIEKLNNVGLFGSRLNLDQVGVMGWSFGGATAVDACIADERFKAGINIDGWPYGEHFNSEKTLSQPVMVINAESDDETDHIVGEMVFDRSENDSYRLTIENTSHTNFWDFPLFFNVLKYLDYWGPMGAARLAEINNTYVIGFFDTYLKGSEVSEFKWQYSPDSKWN